MKKTYISLIILILATHLLPETSWSQVLIVDDFETYQGAPSWPTSFGGEWDTSFPGFALNSNSPCEGSQSVRRIFSSSGVQAAYLQYLFQEVTGEDVEVSFEYKVVNENTGNPISGNWGSIVLSYTADNGVTWDVYDTIDPNSPNSASCETHTYTIPHTDLPSGSEFGWRADVIWNQGDYYVYIDNFQAVEQVDCIAPYNVEISDLTFDEADVSWGDINNPAPTDGWDITLTPSNFPLSLCGGTNDPCLYFNTSLNPYTITNLEEGTPYDVYISAICDDGNNIESAITGPVTFQTVAIGTDCHNPIAVHNDPDNPNAGQPYLHSSETHIYDTSYSSSPGIGCGAAGGNFLNGYDVVYHYIPDDDDILTVEVEGLTANHVGVFIYEGGAVCDDNIGSFCIGGDSTTSGDDLEVHSLFVDEDADYYIVIASYDGNQEPVNTEYTITISGFECSAWEEPYGGDDHTAGPPPSVAYPFIDNDPDPGQTLDDFSGKPQGVNTTINGAVLTWYEDNNGSQGSEVTDPLNTIELEDGDCYWITQTIGTCESPALSVCFDEFECDTQLTGITSTTGDEICEDMPASMTLQASVGSDPNADIFWYDSETGEEIIGVGDQLQTPVLSQTTSYWATQVFLGQGNLHNQANPGPVSTAAASSASDDHGLAFEVDSDMILVDVQVFVTGGGVGSVQTLEVDLRDASGGLIDTKAFQVNGGSAATPVANTLSLLWPLDAGQGYRITKNSGPAMLYQTSGDYPYPLGTTGAVTTGLTNFGTSGNYYYFFNWTVTGPSVLCESDREEVIATVHEIEVISVTAGDNVVCVGDSTQLTVSSSNTNYDYTWDSGQQGASITVSPTENTTYTVLATDSQTSCQYEDEITISVIELPSELTTAPEPAQVCIEAFVELTAGGIFEGFEGTTGWTTTNNSSEPDAAWELVSSPYTVSSPDQSASVSSNDHSQFYIANASTVAFGGQLDVILESPSFSLVSVTSASIDFYHYYRHLALTAARVDVSVDGAPWENLATYTSDQGQADDFAFESISLDNYTEHEDVRVRFSYTNPVTGGPGWWWAIDNITIKRRYNGIVTWDPPANLFMDAAGTVPYTAGADTSTVYYGRDDQDGSFTVTATLEVPGCGIVDEDITVTVFQTPPPTGDAQQLFVDGALEDLDVTGTNLTWYVEDNNGNMVQVPSDMPLEHLGEYYVSQTINGCEGDLLMVTAVFDCPAITDLEIVEISASSATVTWTEPGDTSRIEYYRLLVSETEGGSPVFDELLLVGWNTVTVPGLEPETEYIFEIYSICDEEVPIYSIVTETIAFETEEMGIDDISFEGFSYYPNPTTDVVNLANTRPIDRVEIYSLTGQKVLEQSPDIRTTDLQISLGGLASGSYLARVVVGKSVKTLHIIKR